MAIKISAFRLYLVTFDLFGTVPGDQRYRQVDDALRFHGTVFRPVKQLRLIITKRPARILKSAVEQRIGRSATIFVARIDKIPAWRIQSAAKRKEWKAFVSALKAHGIDVKYVSEDTDSSKK